MIMESDAFDCLDAPIFRVTSADVPTSCAANLEALAFPTSQNVVNSVKHTMGLQAGAARRSCSNRRTDGRKRNRGSGRVPLAVRAQVLSAAELSFPVLPPMAALVFGGGEGGAGADPPLVPHTIDYVYTATTSAGLQAPDGPF